MKGKLGFVLAVVLLLTGCTPQVIEKEEAYVPVEVSRVERRTIQQQAALSGILTAQQEAVVMVPIAAKVDRVDVRLGQWVEEDQLLFVLDKEAIEDQVEQAAAAFHQARAAYQSNLEQIRLAKSTAERLKRLYEAGAVSKAELEQAELAASSENMDLLYSGFQQAETIYRQTQSMLEDLTVRAPLSGEISFLGVTQNGYVAPGQPAAMISDAAKMKVAVNLPSKLISQIALGDQVSMEIPAIEEARSGEIVAIGSAVDQQTFLYPIEIEMDNPEGKMLPGMFAKVYLVTDQREDALAVPIEAIVESLGRKRVFVQVEDRAVERMVETGLDDGQYVEILSGLSQGENLVVVGQNFLEDGVRILLVEE